MVSPETTTRHRRPPTFKDTTMTDDQKMIFGLKHLKKLLKRAEQLGYSFEYDGENYPEYVHDLWLSLSKNPVLKERTAKIERKLGYGDTIQLFSDSILDLYSTEFKEN